MRKRTIRPLAGVRSTSKPNLRYRFNAPIEFEEGVANFFRGPNGAGKTTLLERLVVPHVEKSNCSALFWGPDDRNVEMAIRMIVSVRHAIGDKQFKASQLHTGDGRDSFLPLLGPALAIANSSGKPPVVLLDECQPSALDFLTNGADANLSWCIVRHQPENDMQSLHERGIDVRTYKLTRNADLVSIDRVEP